MKKLWNFIKNHTDRIWFDGVFKEDLEKVTCILCKKSLGYLNQYMEGSLLCGDCYEKFPSKKKIRVKP